MVGVFALIFLFCVKVCCCANILIVDTMASPSHQIFNYGIAEKLLERGHNVTIMGPPSVRPLQDKNFHHLDVSGLYNLLYGKFDSEEVSSLGALDMMQNFYDYSVISCNESLHSTGFKTLMNYPKDFKFDIILIDLTVGECFLPLIQRFNYPPAAALTALILPTFLAYDFGIDLQLAYIPSFHTTYSDDMTFVERLYNYVATYTDIYFRRNYLDRELTKLVVKEFGDGMEPLHSLEKRVSLLFANWNTALNYPQAFPPNIIPIGGSHIKVKKLPKDIQEIMDNSPNGVIFFSLGTNVRADKLSEEKRKIFVNTFSKLKQTVLWKFESNITGLSSNVLIRKWLPQTDILAHPNLKLFITHCGGLSTIETAYFGVPVLGMPFFVDQLSNVKNLVNKGVARELDHAKLTEELFLENVKELLFNDKYSKNAKELSARVRDEPQTPSDRAAFWIEYAIRHNGAHFLNAKSRTLPLFISSSADVHLFILITFCVAVCSLLFVFNCVKSSFKQNVKSDVKSKKE